MTFLARPVLALSGPISPNFFDPFIFGESIPNCAEEYTSTTGNATCVSVLLRLTFGLGPVSRESIVGSGDPGTTPFLTAVRLDLGLVLGSTVSVAERDIDCLEEVDFSLRRASTVDPCADPGNGFRRVVVLDLTIPAPCLGSAETVPLGLRSGDEGGEIRAVVVKKERTLSATRLILALARLWDFVRVGGGPSGLSTMGMVVRGSCGGGVDWRISPSTFCGEEMGAMGLGTTFLEEAEEGRRWRRRVAVLSPEAERFLVIDMPPLLGG
jgi:hypothetical protein